MRTPPVVSDLLPAGGWVEKNQAKALKPPKLPDKSTKVKVFTDDQITQILDACDEYPEWNAYGHDNHAAEPSPS